MIATQTISSNTTTVTFSSIPNTYTDLKMVMYGPGDNYFLVRFNGDTSTNYSYISLNAITYSGAATASERGTGQTSIMGGKPDYGLGVGKPSIFVVDVFSYAGSTTKSCLITGTSQYTSGGFLNKNVGLWRSTSAITSLVLDAGGAGQSFKATCTFSLYGIQKA